MPADRHAPARGSTRPAVIMGLWPTGLAALRTLTSMGVPCLGLDGGSLREVGRHSKHLIRVLKVPYPPSPQQLLSALDELTEPWAGAMPVLIPASDVYARLVDEMQDQLRTRYTFRCSRAKHHAALVDKVETIDVCRNAGVRIPRTQAIRETDDIERVCEEFRFPVIIKPRRNDGIDFPGKNFVAGRSEELTHFLADRPDLIGQLVAQEVISSEDGNIIIAISYSGRDRKVIAQMTLRKLRQWPPDYGMACFARSESLPEVAAISQRFLEDIGYEGLAAIEFAGERETGRYFLLEVNPRLCLPTELALDANVDIIRTAYQEMTQDEPWCVAPPSQTVGAHWIDLRFDALSFLVKWRKQEISLRDWLRSIPRANSYAIYDPRDPRPSLVSSAALVREMLELIGRWLTAGLRRLARITD